MCSSLTQVVATEREREKKKREEKKKENSYAYFALCVFECSLVETVSEELDESALVWRVSSHLTDHILHHVVGLALLGCNDSLD